MELKNIYIEATEKTPYIDLNPITGEFIFSGKSIPENPAKIYESLLKWVQEYARNPKKTTNLRLNIEYFNTASVIWLAKIIKALCTMKESENTLFIHLYFDIEEFDSMETEDVKETLSPVLDMVGTPSINLGIKLYGTGEKGEILKETMVLILFCLHNSGQTSFSSIFWHNFITPKRMNIMLTRATIFISIISIMNIFSQDRSTDRQPVAAGRFYSANKESLIKDISDLFAGCTKPAVSQNVRAVISPHAGYVFSGRIAASAFSITPKNAKFSNIFIIGSSHIMAFEGASVYYTGDFITPLGRAIVNRDIANKLRNENKVFNFPTSAHYQEHSLEVQIPLIQYYYTNTPKIVPIIIGTNNINTIKKIAEALKPWFTPDNLFVISSDFSHYPSYKDAVVTDNLTAEGLISGNPKTFLNTLERNSSRNINGLATSMCGWTSGLVILNLAAGNENLVFKKIDYCNSGDSRYGSKDEVVGYHAIALIEKNKDSKQGEKSSESFTFTEDEINELFSISRNSIRTMLYDNKRITVDETRMPESLKEPLGAFVTLKIDGVLRGCIGRFISSDPLYEIVKAAAISSAFEDPRFPALTKQEYDKVNIEITVLGPLKKINDINDIILGRHGIYIKKDFKSGTMLPQVATEYGWTVEEYLGYTSRDKAGLGWDGWKDAEVFIYEGLVLEENKK